jgi:hypothetical protein
MKSKAKQESTNITGGERKWQMYWLYNQGLVNLVRVF